MMNIRGLTVVFLSAFVMATGASAGSKLLSKDIDEKSAIDAAAQQPNDFVITFQSQGGERSKFITYGWNGFAGNLIRWRYNDANRSASISSSASDAVARLQTAMGKWSAVCNLTFQYDGATSLPAGLASGNGDSVNVVAWGPLSGNSTGVTYVAASGPGPSGPFTLNESDMILNNVFNPNVDVTMLHEVGHMLDLDHSNVQNVVMSGPPLTAYVSLNAITADDVAGCQNLYGAPVATTRVISGAISNGGGVYSCTVPNGWAGTLHSLSVANNRIPPQKFTVVNANVTRNVTALSGVPGCNLDVDNNGLIEPGTDGVAIIRRMMGFTSSAFAGLAGTCAGNATSTAIFNATSSNYNVTSGASTFAATDGLAILRAMNGKTGTDVTNGLGLTNESGASSTT